MSQQTTIRKLAELVNTPVEKLLEQLAEAGMSFSGPDQVVTSMEKVKLLGFLKRSHGKADTAGDDAASPGQDEPRYVLLADPQTTPLAPLLQRMLLGRTHSLQGLWSQARLDGLRVADVILKGNGPLASVKQACNATE